MPHTEVDKIAEALERQGLTPTQRHILELRLIAAGGESKMVDVGGKLRQRTTWADDTVGGKKVPAMHRTPIVRTGAVPTRIQIMVACGLSDLT